MNNSNRAAEARLLQTVSLVAIALLLLALAACSGNSAGESAASTGNNMTAENTNNTMSNESMDDDMSGDDDTNDMSGDDDMMDEDMSGDDAMEEDMSDDDHMDDTMDEDMSDDSMSDDAEAMDEDMSGDDDMEAPMDGDTSGGMDGETMADLPAWQELSLVNARTGETFTLADFRGQRVFVEPMATWCTNCRQQLQNVQAAQATAPDDAVFIALSVETNLSAEQLAAYADTAGFDWHFAVMTPEMLQALVGEFGRSIANPPSTPHFVIASDGTWTDLVTGIDEPETLIAQITSVQ